MADGLYLWRFKMLANCTFLDRSGCTNGSFSANVGGQFTVLMFDKWLISDKLDVSNLEVINLPLPD